ncbi:MAG: hypothetical protein M3010_08790 [Candidatus Dormibacteraeota bacterium]|nr:hypothetical protein [Candidatus Dormibacteraeota bacterium]
MDHPDPTGSDSSELAREPIEDGECAGRAADQHAGMLLQVGAEPPQGLTRRRGAAQHFEDYLRRQVGLHGGHGSDNATSPVCVDGLASVRAATIGAPSPPLRVPSHQPVLTAASLARAPLPAGHAG